MANNILIIEDNIDDYEAIERAFKACSNAKLHWFDFSDKAIDYLLAEKTILPDFILLDLNLPGMDGRSL